MKKTQTRRALLMSALALLVCLSMLVGSTFAWFTDSVVSANNIIKSGNLDVEMYWAEGEADPNATDTVWTDASTGAIFNYDLWEPGYTEVRHIKIANEGTLALKYQLKISANGEVSNLAKVIDVYFTDPANTTDRAMTGMTRIGTLNEVLEDMPQNVSGSLLAGNSAAVTIALKMQEDAGNEYQNMSIGSNFSVILMATQLTYENDSFDDQYDADAGYPVVDAVQKEDGVAATVGTDDVKVNIPANAPAGKYTIEVTVTDETTDAAGNTNLAMDIVLKKDGVKVETDGTTVYAVDVNIGGCKTITAVTHNGTALTNAKTGEDQTYTYDPVTGVVTICTKSFSPFAVTYTDGIDFVRKLNRGHSINSYISTSTGSNFLPIVAMMPEITGYSVFDGDTRLTDAVHFRFTRVEKQAINENSYKVLVEFAVKDANGNDVELKPGMPSTINGKEYVHVYMNLIEVPADYSISEVKVNGTALTETNSGNPVTGEYWIGYDAKDLYFQAKEAGLIEVTVAKTN